MNPVVLEAEKIIKKFLGGVPLKDISINLRAGEIHGLCGENGAGKSTLIKLLSGIYPYGSYEGDFFVHGQLAKFRSLADAQKAGIAVIYQELALVDDMTVGENIFLGAEPPAVQGLIDWHRVYHDARLLLEKFNVGIDPSEPIAKLGMGQKQLVEIVKALSKNSNILILDEPTAALAEHEVLGIGALMGAGRTELLMHLFGAWGRRLSGSVRLNGRELSARKPEEIIRRGMVLVSEDRRRYGLISDKTIGFNLSLSSLAKLTKSRLIDQGLEFQKNNHFFQSLRVKAPTLEVLVAKLSGGTQQKIVLGKALMTEPFVIFLDEPTRGIDVGAKLEIYEIINRLTDAGKAVLLVSSELPELIGMSDRIVMLHEGRIGGEFDRDEATPEKLLAAAMGQRHVALT